MFLVAGGSDSGFYNSDPFVNIVPGEPVLVNLVVSVSPQEKLLPFLGDQ